MTFTQAIASGFSKYVTLSGRAARSEFWYWTLFVFVCSLSLGMLDGAIFPLELWGPLGTVFGIVTFLPGIAVSVRRLHDLEKSGYWLFLMLLPIIGWIVLFVWDIRRGIDGGNRFGEDPLAAGTPSVLQASDPLR